MIQTLARMIGQGMAQVRSKYLGQGPNIPLDTLDDYLDFVSSGGGDTWSGQAVTGTSAMRVAAVWACVNMISGAVAQLPLAVFRQNPQDGTKTKARDHYLYPIFHNHVNPCMTPFRFKRLMQTRLCMDGNALAYEEISGRGQIIGLWPLPMPLKQDVTWTDGGPVYRWRLKDGGIFEQPWYNILHLRGLETDGFWGLNPIQQHRQTIGLALAIKEHGARFFSNGARPLGALKCTAVLTPEELVQRREAWNAVHQGGPNAHKIAVLMGGMEYQEIGVNMVDAQYIDAQNLTVLDICRIYGVPPHMVAELTRATYSNIESQAQEWLQDCLGPWLVNWEEELTNSLLSDREAETIILKFNINALMRTDTNSRANYYARGILSGWLTPNQAAGFDGLDPFEGGDVHLQPLNMVPLGSSPPVKTLAKQPVQGGG